MRVAVIGGGPAGMMSAYSAHMHGADVTLLEKNEKLGKKLYITGKGRCNVTNLVDVKTFLQNVNSGKKFLYSALSGFSPEHTVQFFEQHGCKIKVERGNRAFPVSDKASDITKAFLCALQGVELSFKTLIEPCALMKCPQGFELCGANYDRVIVACGGASYPLTGSCGEGYDMAKRFGHTIVQPVPALVALHTHEDVKSIQGLSLINVRLFARHMGSVVFDQMGEMLFTHEGISGPLVLSLSSAINRLDLSKLQVFVDLKPALSVSQLDARVQRDFLQFSTKQFKNCLSELLPKSLIDFVVARSGIEPCKVANQITALERARLVEVLKNLQFTVRKLDDLQNAIVTAGGVSLQEIDPKTMQSKLQKGLFFAGECMDLDALTGGFNIQIALSTGYAAGKYAAILE